MAPQRAGVLGEKAQLQASVELQRWTKATLHFEVPYAGKDARLSSHLLNRTTKARAQTS